LWLGGNNNNKIGLREVLAAARTRRPALQESIHGGFILEMKRKEVVISPSINGLLALGATSSPAHTQLRPLLNLFFATFLLAKEACRGLHE
jgi:hypothetical protein